MERFDEAFTQADRLRSRLHWLWAIFVVTGCSKVTSSTLSTVPEQSSQPKSTTTHTATESEQAVKSPPQTVGSNLNKSDSVVEGEHPHKPGSHGGIIIANWIGQLSR